MIIHVHHCIPSLLLHLFLSIFYSTGSSTLTQASVHAMHYICLPWEETKSSLVYTYSLSILPVWLVYIQFLLLVKQTHFVWFEHIHAVTSFIFLATFSFSCCFQQRFHKRLRTNAMRLKSTVGTGSYAIVSLVRWFEFLLNRIIRNHILVPVLYFIAIIHPQPKCIS